MIWTIKLIIFVSPTNGQLMKPYINGIFARKEINDKCTTLTEDDVYSHGSSMVIINDVVYAVSIANSVTHKEWDSNTFVRLTVFNIDTPSLKTHYAVCGSGTYGSITLTSGATCVGIANLGNGSIGLTFFAPYNGTAVKFYRSFNITTKTFSELQICTFTFNNATYDFTESNFNLIIGKAFGLQDVGEMAMESFNLYNGCLYSWVTGGDEFDGVLLKTTNMVNYEYVSTPRLERVGMQKLCLKWLGIICM